MAGSSFEAFSTWVTLTCSMSTSFGGVMDSPFSVRCTITVRVRTNAFGSPVLLNLCIPILHPFTFWAGYCD
ncbi:uncharacterized protein EV420DRAFT_1558412 [Desarmillaria tabescens]|uniref:Uncharacterized protein n=1 Tax=Armillaria tabescens TaxID=1929756 RepID=A0AA39K3N0_ARMTA|nr:uncharacterized protein EV420DRAFT_1558412 [Desarmillaria tabescens]KAK0452771.1 hypothetical protein EV420DRAFT_1558412 [Desarmillaria tabescens]